MENLQISDFQYLIWNNLILIYLYNENHLINVFKYTIRTKAKH